MGGIFIVKIFEASIFLLQDPALPDNLSTAQASDCQGEEEDDTFVNHCDK